MEIFHKEFLNRTYRIKPEIQKKIRFIKNGEIIFTNHTIHTKDKRVKNELKHFNNMASGILFWIYEGSPLINILNDIIDKFEVDVNQAKDDLIEFIKKLEYEGIIELVIE